MFDILIGYLVVFVVVVFLVERGCRIFLYFCFCLYVFI